MIYNEKENKVSDVKIAYIGGGSTGWAWTFMSDLALEGQLSGSIYLYDIKSDLAKRNETIGNKITDSGVVGRWDYYAAETLAEAVKDADFVVVSILPGTFDDMNSDVHYLETYGLYQSVGDTTGPGGLIRTLRTIPMFVEIAETVKTYAPNTWVINYTNPMSTCVQVLYDVFPEIKAFGCCHEVFGTQEVLAGIVEKEYGLNGVNRQDIQVNVLGINHFTWFDYASYKGIDLFPVYQKYIDKNFDEGYVNPNENWLNKSFASANRVKFDLFKRFGLIAAAGDRHLAEFMPANDYLADQETVDSWDFGLTKVDWRKQDLTKRLAKSEQLSSGEATYQVERSGEEGILLIKALLGLERVISNVNIPNTNEQIENLPANAVVETNALFERDAIRPIFAGEIPERILTLVTPHVENHQIIVDAAMNHNIDLVIDAFKRDPLVKDKIKTEDVAGIVIDMIENTIDSLPQEWEKVIAERKNY